MRLDHGMGEIILLLLFALCVFLAMILRPG